MPTMRWPTQRLYQREQQGILLELSDQQLPEAQGSAGLQEGQAIKGKQGQVGNHGTLRGEHDQ